MACPAELTVSAESEGVAMQAPIRDAEAMLAKIAERRYCLIESPSNDADCGSRAQRAPAA
jgi:hypothetical protein